MVASLQRLSDIRNYRWASVALIVAMISLPALMIRLGAMEWVASLAALPIYVALVVLTYRRLRHAGLTGWWVVLMIMQLNFGPRWGGLEPATLHVSHLIHLIPVALGWLVQAPGAVAATRARPMT